MDLIEQGEKLERDFFSQLDLPGQVDRSAESLAELQGFALGRIDKLSRENKRLRRQLRAEFRG